MLREEENDFIVSGWRMSRIADFEILNDFDCDDDDLNDYFRNEVKSHKEQLLNETYLVHPEEASGDQPVVSFSMCNDSVSQKHTKKFILLPDPKNRYPDLPAVKIARFGVQKKFQGHDIGTHAMNMIKKIFITKNRTGCRLLTVDAYNKEKVIKFYLKNEFQFLTKKDENRQTRTMFFDLMRLKK